MYGDMHNIGEMIVKIYMEEYVFLIYRENGSNRICYYSPTLAAHAQSIDYLMDKIKRKFNL
jgi:hypothetical protein